MLSIKEGNKCDSSSLDASSNKICADQELKKTKDEAVVAAPVMKQLPFWAQDPNVLIRAPFDFFPMPEMTLEQKLNALTRGLVIVTAVAYLSSQNSRLPIICLILLVAIFLYYWAYKRQEGFLEANKEAVDRFNKLDKALAFQDGTPINPLSNVLISDWVDNPRKKPAPPCEKNTDNILTQAKRMVVQSNPGQPDIAEKLFADLANELEFEQSMRPFYSTAASTIPNDQGAFAEFCYGSMVSCKEGNMFACARDNPQYRNQ